MKERMNERKNVVKNWFMKKMRRENERMRERS